MPVALQILTSRILMGFAIGISCLRLWHWSIHGAVMGFLFGVPLAFGGMMAKNPSFSPIAMLMTTLFISVIYGLLTELITSVFFRARTTA